MEKKIVTTVNSPLLYISQPNFLEVKPKMQQMCVVKPKAPNIEKMPDTIQIDTVHEEEKPIPIENNIEVRETSNENIIEDKPKPIENIIKDIPKPIENIIKDKPKSIENIMKEKQLPIDRILEKKRLSKQIEPIIEEKFIPIEQVIVEKPKHVEKIIEEKAQPIIAENIIEANPISNKISNGEKANLIENIIEEKLVPNENPIDEKALAKRKMIATYGIKSSFEKGKKAAALQKKQKSDINNILAAYGLKSSVEKGKKSITLPTQEFTIMNDEVELKLNQVQEEVEEIITVEEPIEKSQKPRPFKVLSIEEKVDYLVHLPLGVPKVKCEFDTKQGKFQGVVAGYVNGVVRIIQSRKPHQLNVKIEDIIAINRKSF